VQYAVNVTRDTEAANTIQTAWQIFAELEKALEDFKLEGEAIRRREILLKVKAEELRLRQTGWLL
jgi:hypothetical protein